MTSVNKDKMSECESEYETNSENDGDSEHNIKLNIHEVIPIVINASTNNIIDGSTNINDASTNIINTSANIIDASTNIIDTSTNIIDTSCNIIDISNNLTNIIKILLNNNKIPFNLDTFIKNTSGHQLDKLTFRNVNDIIKTHYTYKENHSSTALDILAVFMKGQKILYTESKTLCEQKLNFLMLPAIFISSVCTVLSVVISGWEWGKILVSALNAFNAFLLAVISYMKLDAKAEAHKTSSYKYDKLQSECEFYSGKLLFFSSKDDDIDKKIDEIEGKVKEIKETNQFILPEIIRNRYHVLYSTNVFSEVKKIQYDEMIIINQLKDIINEAINIKNFGLSDKNKPRLIELEKLMNINLKNVIEHKKKFLDIGVPFEKEIERARVNRHNSCCRFDFLKS